MASPPSPGWSGGMLRAPSAMWPARSRSWKLGGRDRRVDDRERGLGRRVTAESWQDAEGRGRTHVDDGPSGLRPHDREHGLHPRYHGNHVQLENDAQVVGVELLDGNVKALPGIAPKHTDFSVGVDDSSHESFRVLRNGGTGCHREHARPVSRGAQPGVQPAQPRAHACATSGPWPQLCGKELP